MKVNNYFILEMKIYVNNEGIICSSFKLLFNIYMTKI